MLTVFTMIVTALGVVGQVFRDRFLLLTLLFYIPLVPLTCLLICHDLARAGRCLPRVRFSQAAVGVGILAWCIWTMTGHSPAGQYQGAGDSQHHTEVRLVQWNVRWGGAANQADAWQSLTSDIVRRAPDVVVLSEAPSADKVRRLTDALGAEWSVVSWRSERHARYQFSLAVCSRWTLGPVDHFEITDGKAMSVTVDTPGQPIHLLVVDGQSRPTLPRTPRLTDILRPCQSAANRGEPVDVIVGDFNAVSRSVGFDDYGPNGFVLASKLADGWRATYPSTCPLYDIDHVWLGRHVIPVDCQLFTNLRTDHRGQVVRFSPLP